jgi:hypothetical protein
MSTEIRTRIAHSRQPCLARTLRQYPRRPDGHVDGEETVTLIARFKVEGFEPRQVAGLDADWFSLLTFAKTFTSGITGTATTLFMSAGTEEGSRSYLATERITGRTDDGREGSVTVQHGGLESDPGTWFGHIVPGTGTGGFTGWSGSARIVHDDDGACFEINLA